MSDVSYKIKPSTFANLPGGFTARQIAASISPKFLELIILPTEKCNFRCTFCYEDFEIGAMSEGTILGIENLISRRVPTLEKLRLSWFGGEPLVAKKIVLRIASHAKLVCEQHNVNFDGGLTTNAYLLTSDLAALLISLKQNFFQITLDGWKAAHDDRRKRADGLGTFDQIWENLLSLRNQTGRFEVCVRVHVRRDNLSSLEQLMTEFASAFQGDKRFYLDFQHLRDMGGEGGKTVENPISRVELLDLEANFRRIYQSALRQQTKLGLPDNDEGKQFRDGNVDIAPPTDQEQIRWLPANASESAGSQRASERVTDEPYICYAARANSLLVRANGRLGKCTVAFHDARNDIGSILEDGSINIDNKKLQPWIRGLGTLNAEDVGCPIQHMEPLASGNNVSKVSVVRNIGEKPLVASV